MDQINIATFYSQISSGGDLFSLAPNTALVVISPHPDDDVIGMGGTIAIKACQEKIVSICLTDGAGSLRNQPRESIGASRKDESLQALAIVGAYGAFFLGVSSRTLIAGNPGYSSLCQSLGQIIDYLAPREIYLTAPFENHRTHLRSTSLVIKLLRQSPPVASRRIYGYPVWGPLPGQQALIHSVDIGTVIDIKRRAIAAHLGEVAYKDYVAGATARNLYQAVFEDPHQLRRADYLETFLDMSELLPTSGPTLKQFAANQLAGYLDQIYPQDQCGEPRP